MAFYSSELLYCLFVDRKKTEPNAIVHESRKVLSNETEKYVVTI